MPEMVVTVRPSLPEDEQAVIVISYRSREYQVPLPRDNSSTSALIHAVAAATGTDPATVKLLGKGLPTITLATPRPPVHNGHRFLLMASTASAVRAVQNASDLPGMAGFDHEARVHEQRTAPDDGSTSSATHLPRTPYTFARFATWSEPGLTLQPPESEALRILHRLASDRGIRTVMERYKWSVGLLAEMPPEGKVGITPVCVLGYNVNAGQEIHLRLRTDDLAGFRPYARIRETLVHELAHNVHADHDDRFKALNSELLKQVLAAQGGSARHL